MAEAILWGTGTGRSSWTGVVLPEPARTTATAVSSSMPAAPSPHFNEDLLRAFAASGSGLAGGSSTSQSTFTQAFLTYVLKGLSVIKPTRILFALARTIQSPGGAISATLSVYSSVRDEVMSWSWKPVMSDVSNDIFLGQVLTCVLVISVIAAWFTREWVLMHLPLPDHVPENLREAGQILVAPGRQQPVRVGIPAPRGVDPLEAIQAHVAEMERDLAARDLAERDLAERNLRQARRMVEHIRRERGMDVVARGEPTPLEPNQPEQPERLPQLADLIDIERALVDTRDAADASSEVQAEPNDEADNDDDQEPSQEVMTESARSARLARFAESSSGTTAETAPLLRGGGEDELAFPDPSDTETSAEEHAAGDQEQIEDLDGLNSGSEDIRLAQDVGDVLHPLDRALDYQAVDTDASTEEETQAGLNGSERSAESSHFETDSDSEAERPNPQTRGRADGGQRLLPPPNVDGDENIRRAWIQALDPPAAAEAGLPAAQRPVENAAPPQLGQLAAQPPPAARPAGNGENEEDWDDVEGELERLMEAVGFRGEWIHLLANLSLVIALSYFCIIGLVGTPYLFGRLFGLGSGLWEIVMAPVRLTRLVTDPLFDLLIDWSWRGLLKMGGKSSRLPTWAVTMMTQSQPANNSTIERFSHAANEVIQQRLDALPQPAVTAEITATPFKSFWSSLVAQSKAAPMQFSQSIVTPVETKILRASSTSDHALSIMVGLGWVVIAIAAIILRDDWSVRRGQTPSAAILKELVAQFFIVAKVLTFLTVEIIVFPIGCGIVLDFSTLPLFGATFTLRAQRLLARPVTWIFIRWAAGTLWMFRFGLFVSHLRKTLRPGVLSWIRDPDDPDFQPIKEILERKSVVQMRKIWASAMMYNGLILALFGFNSWAMEAVRVSLAGSSTKVLPLRLSSSSETGSAIPYDLFAMLFGLPTVIKILQPEETLAKLSARWWRAATYSLGVMQYFFDVNSGKLKTFGRTTALALTGPTFRARVPASDNSVIGCSVMITVDNDGVPISDRGKEDLDKQLDKIAKMKAPKAKYTTMTLPMNFKKRVYLLLTLLWASISISVITLVLGPVLIGRAILDNIGSARHDTYAWLVGTVLLSSIFLCLKAAFGHKHRPLLQALLDRPDLGGLPTAVKDRENRKRAMALRRARGAAPRSVLKRALYRLPGTLWFLIAFGLITPSLIGINVDQLIVSPLRSSNLWSSSSSSREAGQVISLPYAWTLGLLLQEVFCQAMEYHPKTFWLVKEAKELRKKGLVRRLTSNAQLVSVRKVTKDLFLPLVVRLVSTVFAPQLLTAALVRATYASMDGQIVTFQNLSPASQHFYTTVARNSVLILTLILWTRPLLASKFKSYEREVRDQVYLKASELRNYQGDEDKKKRNGSAGGEKGRKREGINGVDERRRVRRRRNAAREVAGG